MRKLLFAIVLFAAQSWAQVVYQVPQTVPSTPLSAVSAAGASGCITNVGQNVHILNYTVTSAGEIQIRLEGSFNSDSATCSTGTWQAISDDATDVTGGEVVGIGAYPFIRANLVTCVTCTGVTARYTGTSSAPSNLYGFYNPSQQIKKVVFVGQAPGSNATSASFPAPYGSTAGTLVVIATLGLPANSTFAINASHSGITTQNAIATYTYTSGGTMQAFSTPATPATSVTVTYTSGGGGGGTFLAYYIFYPPGAALPAGAQPAATANSEATAVNATVTTTLTASQLLRGHLFTVSARCSAGTAQITVKDGATTIWTSAATEVGATTFMKQWNPGLPSSPGANLVVTLSTCGAANTGTLDVQGSVF